MLIDPFQPEWQLDLNRRHETLPPGAHLVLLIDSAFVSKIFRQLGNGCKPILLFELLPACSKEAKDVSPFVVAFDPSDISLMRLLARCSGWPMLSVLTTYESVEQLSKRLAAWCLVDVEGQNFNFRFPDTRRLPAIFQTLTKPQHRELIGNSIGWHYIGRDGSWCGLLLEPSTLPLPISDKATLNGLQFGQLLKDSEPDEIWVQLLDRGARPILPPSQRHALLANALQVAEKNGLDDTLKVAWCMDCIEKSHSDPDTLQVNLAEWAKENLGGEDETLCRAV